MMGTAVINVIGPMVTSGKFAGVAQNGMFEDGKFVRRKFFADTPLISELLDGQDRQPGAVGPEELAHRRRDRQILCPAPENSRPDRRGLSRSL